MTNQNEQPYLFEGGMQERTQTEFYTCPPTNVYRSNSNVTKILVNSLEDLTESFGSDPKFVALETD